MPRGVLGSDRLVNFGLVVPEADLLPWKFACQEVGSRMLQRSW